MPGLVGVDGPAAASTGDGSGVHEFCPPRAQRLVFPAVATLRCGRSSPHLASPGVFFDLARGQDGAFKKRCPGLVIAQFRDFKNSVASSSSRFDAPHRSSTCLACLFNGEPRKHHAKTPATGANLARGVDAAAREAGRSRPRRRPRAEYLTIAARPPPRSGTPGLLPARYMRPRSAWRGAGARKPAPPLPG
jgi:hypothetical protein